MATKWVKSLQCKSRAADDVIHLPLLQSTSCRSLKDVIRSKPEKKPKPVTKPVAKPGLPPGHPSRNVVEIIFRTRWANFPGRVDLVFKIQNSEKKRTRFEEYRDSVKSRTGSSRCAADGNEMMRFYCMGPTSSSLIDVCSNATCKSLIGTFSGSGAAHDNAGGGKGRRAMLVCRVIAGRVGSDPDSVKGFDSVSCENGELLVFDARAVLPCFLVIYKL